MHRLRGGRLAAWLVPIIFGGLATAFRLLSKADLANDHYMTLGWAQQVLLGAWPERDFIEPGMPLSYLYSSLVQYYWPGPFSELAVTSAFVGAAAGVTVLCAARLSGSWLIGVFVALIELGFNPQLHSFHKVLTPVVTLALLQAYGLVPSRRRLVWLGLWVAVSVLFRHDLGLYAALGALVGLVVQHWRQWRACGNALLWTAVGGLILMAPYGAYVQWASGWSEHVRRGAEFGKSEVHQLFTGIPGPAALFQADRSGAVAWLFFGAHLLLLIGLVVLIVRRRELESADAGAAAAAMTLLALFLPVILREPIDGRLTDLAGVFALGLAWVLGEGTSRCGRLVRRGRHAAAAVTAVVLVIASFAAGTSVWALGRVDEQIDDAGLYAGIRGVRETWEDLRDRGRVWPWARFWPTRELPQAVLYLRACTSPTDAVLLNWRAPEYNFFARRRFAAGHVEFLPPSSYTSDADQQWMLDRLAHESVPVMLKNLDQQDEFEGAYPRVNAYLESRYNTVGTFTIYDGARIEIRVRRGLTATRTWGPDEWPCGFE